MCGVSCYSTLCIIVISSSFIIPSSLSLVSICLTTFNIIPLVIPLISGCLNARHKAPWIPNRVKPSTSITILFLNNLSFNFYPFSPLIYTGPVGKFFVSLTERAPFGNSFFIPLSNSYAGCMFLVPGSSRLLSPDTF